LAANNRDLPEKERLTRQRTYNTLRTFDAYVTSSLGLPRQFRIIQSTDHSAESSFIDCPEMLLAADANLELLDILGITLEKVYFTDATAGNQASKVYQYNQLREVGGKLEEWARKYTVFTQLTAGSLATCTK
jgi:hypothetical protein